MTSLAESRVEEVMAMATADGSDWADAVRGRLRAEGRRISGMWPGTLGEARVRARRILARALDEAAPRDVREQVARALYAAARRDWNEGGEA